MREREQLLRDIGIADFVLIELALYLDTHPHDRRAMEYFNHYNRIKNQMEKEWRCFRRLPWRCEPGVQG